MTMTDPSEKPTGEPTNLWSELFIPKPVIEDGLLSELSQRSEAEEGESE